MEIRSSVPFNALSLALVVGMFSGCAISKVPHGHPEAMRSVYYSVWRPALAALNRGDFDAAGVVSQTATIFGREDLVLRDEDRHGRGETCVAINAPVREKLLELATSAEVLMFSEAHDASRHRAFVGEFLPALRELGYSVFAAEAFDSAGLSSMAGPSSYGEGFYVAEPLFGQLLESARKLGYQIAPYEMTDEQGVGTDKELHRGREYFQAMNLADVVKRHPGQKVVVLAGYGHIQENIERPGDPGLMAQQFKSITGIDPLTIAQTECVSSSAETVLALRSENYQWFGGVDSLVGHPVDNTFVDGRPEWRVARGDQLVDIPPELLSSHEDRVVEAFEAGRPFTSIPYDRVFVRAGEKVRLLLKAGNFDLRSHTLADIQTWRTARLEVK